MPRPRRFVLAALLLATACGDGGDTSSNSSASTSTGPGPGTAATGSTGEAATDTQAATTSEPTTGGPNTDATASDPTTDAATSTTASTSTTTDASTTSDASGSTTGAGSPSAAALLALTRGCQEVSKGDYQSDDEDGAPANIPICGLVGAVFWTADMDVDCDGKETAQCNINTDAAFQNQTSAEDSKGQPLDAANLPFVVIPLPSARFDYNQAGLELGSVVAVIYQGQVRYGVFGDEGPDNIIGEASYAMAASLGIDPDPSFGGTDGPVTYIAFTAPGGVVGTIEDHDEAVMIGEARAAQLLADN